MNTAVINIKTKPELKHEAQRVAEELGFSLSSIMNGYLRTLVRTKTITFTVNTEEPSEYFMQTLKASREDIKAGRVSPTFNNADNAIAWLNDSSATYQNGDTV